MTALDRRLLWEACLNVRDLGGLRCGDQQIRHGRLVRASVIGALSPAGREAMLAHGIRTVIDVRGDDEVAETPSPFADGAIYVRTPLNSLRLMGLHQAAHAGTLRDEFEKIAARGGGLAECFAAIAAAEPGIVLHCTAGRDRTGLVVALLLSSLGASDEDVVADYVMSDAALADEYVRFKRANPERAAGVDEGIAKRSWVMTETLAALRALFGGAASFLRVAGVAPDVVPTIRAKLLV